MSDWHRYQYNTNDSLFSVTSGAFFGAFFAFLFGLTAYFVQKKLDRYHKHKNAVVELEYLLQEQLDCSAANQYLLEGAIKTISDDKFSFTLINNFRIPEDLSLKLGELALINRYADYAITVHRMNHSMQTWQKMNELLHTAAISAALTTEARGINQKHLIDQAIVILKFLKGMDDETKYLASYVRVFMMKDKNIWSVPMLKRSRNNREDIVSDEEAMKELSRMEEEIADVQKKSKEKIGKILKEKI